jgi:hypothetical protein
MRESNCAESGQHNVLHRGLFAHSLDCTRHTAIDSALAAGKSADVIVVLRGFFRARERHEGFQ